MVQLAHEGAGEISTVPWKLLDELAELLSVYRGTFFVVFHEGLPSKLVTNWERIIHFNRKEDGHVASVHNGEAAAPDNIVQFVESELAAWMRGHIGKFGHAEVFVTGGLAAEIILARSERRV